ncbi:hypothetical protein JMJ35_003707 [Cladonia borealis]|uniref:Major facilitator superfamily (MFS) profile domain-containing protein n=1 Tax=Cladonia borealis TaxID=184061 RepID=A0AA39R365_9LECA|nr:hypothetical protein JMJ35_003707 [Cladonia borealis]
MSPVGDLGSDSNKLSHIEAAEKNAPRHYSTDLTTDDGGHILDANQLGAESEGVQTTPDKKIILIPQPSGDPNDPLNWSSLKKHTILLVVTVTAFLPDFGSSMGIVALLPQAMQWDKPQNTIQHNLVGNLFCLGAGGLFTVFLSAYFGRLPVLLSFTSMALGTSAWCGAATSFNSYLAARILNGFFSTVAQAGGLMFIQDIFFFHEHPRKINIWSSGVIVSPYVGPLFTAFIIYKEPWPNTFWVNTGFSALCWLLVVSLMDETIYNRKLPPDQQPVPRSRLLRLIGVEQWRSRHLRQTFFQALMRPLIAISKLPVLLCTVYYFLNFAWVIGVNATISIWLTTFYKFTPYNLGFFYFAPIIGSLLGAVLGHWLHDLVGDYYMRRHSNHIEPEARLIIIWLASPLMAVSILVLGFAIQHTYHYMVIAVFFAGQVMGIMIATVALDAYLLDAYPEGSGEVGAWITVGRAMGGFMATYIEINWVLKSGPLVALGAQTGITAAASLIILVLGLFGKRIRKAQGRMKFAMETGY